MSTTTKLIATLAAAAALSGLWASSAGAIEPMDDPLAFGDLVKRDGPRAPLGIEPMDDPIGTLWY